MLVEQGLNEKVVEQGPRGRTIGFIDSGDATKALLRNLVDHGFLEDHIYLIVGEAGMPQWQQLMKSHQWGEQAEMLFEQGSGALKENRTIFIVDVHSVEEAQHVADIAVACGGQNVAYFGAFVDILLTA
jgi:hypothetical protein